MFNIVREINGFFENLWDDHIDMKNVGKIKYTYLYTVTWFHDSIEERTNVYMSDFDYVITPKGIKTLVALAKEKKDDDSLETVILVGKKVDRWEFWHNRDAKKALVYLALMESSLNVIIDDEEEGMLDREFMDDYVLDLINLIAKDMNINPKEIIDEKIYNDYKKMMSMRRRTNKGPTNIRKNPIYEYKGIGKERKK